MPFRVLPSLRAIPRAILVFLALPLAACNPGEIRPIAFQTMALYGSDNEYLVCPPSYCKSARADRESPEFAVSAPELRDAWMQFALVQPRTELLRSGDRPLQYVFQQRTPAGLPDILTVQFLPVEDNRSALAIYSRSPWGRVDLGSNEQRVNAWLDLLAQRVPQARGSAANPPFQSPVVPVRRSAAPPAEPPAATAEAPAAPGADSRPDTMGEPDTLEDDQ
jgi:hypothetical protein